MAATPIIRVSPPLECEMHLAVLNASCSVLCVDVEASITRLLARPCARQNSSAAAPTCWRLQWACLHCCCQQQASVVRHAARLGHRVFSRNVHGAALICTQSVAAEGDGLRLSWRMKECGCTATNAAKGSWYCAVVVLSMRLCVSNVSFIYRVAR